MFLSNKPRWNLAIIWRYWVLYWLETQLASAESWRTAVSVLPWCGLAFYRDVVCLSTVMWFGFLPRMVGCPCRLNPRIVLWLYVVHLHKPVWVAKVVGYIKVPVEVSPGCQELQGFDSLTQQRSDASMLCCHKRNQQHFCCHLQQLLQHLSTRHLYGVSS